MFQRFLLAWDGSRVALRAFDVAIDLARRYEGELVAVSIAYRPGHAETSSDRDESAAAARRYLQESFTEVRDRADRAGVAAAERAGCCSTASPRTSSAQPRLRYWSSARKPSEPEGGGDLVALLDAARGSVTAICSSRSRPSWTSRAV